MAERQVKCKNCGKSMPKSKAYVFEYLNTKYEIKNKYYCDEKCCEEKESEKENSDKCFELLNEILEFPVRSNIYFNKMYKDIKEHYGSKLILSYLQEEVDVLNIQLMKDFVSLNAKIKYFFAIIQDKLPKYEVIYKARIECVKKEIEDLDVVNSEKVSEPINNKIENKKRSLQDILNSL